MMLDITLTQHWESACFQLQSRKSATSGPHYSLSDILAIDNELRIGLDALSDASLETIKSLHCGTDEWELMSGYLDVVRSGGLDVPSVRRVVTENSHDSDETRQLLRLLSWFSWDSVAECCQQFIVSDQTRELCFALQVFDYHRQSPGPCLKGLLNHNDAAVAALAALLHARIGQPLNLMSNLQWLQQHCEHSLWVEFASELLLRDISDNDRQLLSDVLTDEARVGGPSSVMAAHTLASVLPIRDVSHLVHSLREGNTPNQRLGLQCSGILGIPDGIPWLIEMMAQPQYARVAGEAFYRITGLRLDQRPYEGDWPDGFEAGPNDDPDDDNVEMDEDENLPWPIQHEVAAWWEQNRTRFKSNTRYLLGFELDNEAWLPKVLVLGRQRERATAALELAIRNPTEPLFNVEEHGRRQMKKLGIKRLPSEEYRCNHIEAGPDDTTWMKYLRDSSPFKT